MARIIAYCYRAASTQPHCAYRACQSVVYASLSAPAQQGTAWDHSMRQAECQKLLHAHGAPGLCCGETTPRSEKSRGGTVRDSELGLAIATGPLMMHGGTGGDECR